MWAMRSRRATRSRRPSAARPITSARSNSDRNPPVAIIALDGTQSHRWAAPPTRSRSMRVTSAPSRAATVAAVFPPGPPPTMTNLTLMWERLTAREGCFPRAVLEEARDAGGGVLGGQDPGEQGPLQVEALGERPVEPA